MFTFMAAFALALGIGANTAIFSVVDGVVLEGLPYRDSDRIVMLWEDSTPRGGTNRVPVSPGNFMDWREANPSFMELAALFNTSLRVTSVDEPLVPLTHMVTANYFDLLGVEPALGRTLRPGDDEPGNDRIVILSYGLWQRVYGGEPRILGETIRLDDEPYNVIGVLRSDFHSVHIFGVQPDLWVPLALAGRENERQQRGLAVYGRLADGTSSSEAQAAMSTVAERLGREFPETNEGWDARVVPIQEEATGSVQETLYVLLAAVGFILLMACANVANLTLARAAGRSQEMALRRALGASGWRLSRQLLVESLMLAAFGGVLGVALAAFSLGPLLQLIPAGASVPFLDNVALDAGVLAFTFMLTMLTGVLFGLVPARKAASSNLNDALRLGGRSKPHGSQRLGNALVVAEVTLALMLLAGAGLVIQSFRNLRGFHPGFDAEQVLTIRNSLRGDMFREPNQIVAHFEELAARLEALPGVASVSATSFVPPLNAFRATSFRIPGDEVDIGNDPTATARALLPGYFRTMGIPVLSGRALGERGREQGAPVVVINETLARLYFGDRDPVGDTLVIASSPQREIMAIAGERQIVGVVGNVRTAGTDPTPLPVIYLPHRQAPVAIMNLVMRAEGDPESLAREAEATAWNMPGDINVYGTEVLSERIRSFEWTSDVSALLLGAFAVLALVLGAAGIYAVVSYTVAKQTREIGLRMALGAERYTVVRMVVTHALKLAFCGIALGLTGAFLLARSLGSLLYGVSVTDTATFTAAALSMLAVASIASVVPAWRASRIDPIVALRQE